MSNTLRFQVLTTFRGADGFTVVLADSLFHSEKDALRVAYHTRRSLRESGALMGCWKVAVNDLFEGGSTVWVYDNGRWSKAIGGSK